MVFATVFLFSLVMVLITIAPFLMMRPYKKEKYDTKRKYVALAPPSWLFSVVWIILCILLCISIVLYVIFEADVFDVSPLFISVISLYTFASILHYVWQYYFFKKEEYVISMMITILTFFISIAVAVLFGVSFAWLSFGLYIPYVIWLLFASIIATIWALSKKGVHEQSSHSANAPPSGSTQKRKGHYTNK